MENLASKIRSDLNSYQGQVADQLQHLRNQGLISEVEYRKIVCDAEITAKAVLEGLSYQEQYTEEATEIYVYSLFDKYKGKIERKIREIEEKQKSTEIRVNRKSIIVYFEDETGRLIAPGTTDIEIVEQFLEDVLTISVKSAIIVVGNINRILKLNVPAQDSNLFFSFKTRRFNSKNIQKEKQIIESTYQDFGRYISKIVDSDYSEDEKQQDQSDLINKMKKKVIEKRRSGNFSLIN